MGRVCPQKDPGIRLNKSPPDYRNEGGARGDGTTPPFCLPAHPRSPKRRSTDLMRLSAHITVYNRADLIRAVVNAPVGAQFDLADAPRTTSQNRLLWALLDAFADQVVHCGRKYDAGDWKAIMMKALGKELAFAPSLDGQGIVAIGYQSSRLTKEEMANLIELIYSEGAKRGVVFHGEAA